MRLLRVKSADNSNRTMMVDEAKTVDQLMDVICQRIGIPNNQAGENILHEYIQSSSLFNSSC